MFNTLESNWDQSARRGWSTLASFGFQAMALSLLLAVPLIWTQGPPSVRLIDALLAPPPPPPAPVSRVAAESKPPTSTNMSGTHIIQPPSIPPEVAILNEPDVPVAPDLGQLGVEGGTGRGGRGIVDSIGSSIAIAPPPPPPTPARPLRVSHWSEGNIIYRVQPIYPPLARQARIQGAVVLRAVISKTGTIEHLTAMSGHPMLVGSALNAVRQWRYRPYLLNDEPIEIETEITVNFVLSGQ